MPKKSRIGTQFTERLIESTEHPVEKPKERSISNPSLLPNNDVWKYGFVLKREHSEYLDELVIKAFLKTKKKMERSAVIRALIDLLKAQEVDISNCTTDAEIRETLLKQLSEKL